MDVTCKKDTHFACASSVFPYKAFPTSLREGHIKEEAAFF